MLIRRRGGRQPLAAEESRSLAEEPGGFLFDKRLLTLVFLVDFSAVFFSIGGTRFACPDWMRRNAINVFL